MSRVIRRRRTRFLVALAATSLLAAACGGDDDAPSSQPTPTGDATDQPPASTAAPAADTTPGSDAPAAPPTSAAPGTDAPSPDEVAAGGALTFLNQTEIASLDPAKIGTTITATRGDGAVGFALFGALVLDNPVTGDIDMHFAESLESDDGVVWTLTLRPGIQFSNGVPLDAEAVKLNWERHAEPESTSAAAGAARAMTSIEVLDETTLQVTLDQPNGQWPRTLALYPINLIAAPESWLEGNPDEEPIGAGPFVLEDFVRDDHLTVVRNPSYFDAPRPYLDEITFRPITDGRQRWNALQTGQGDVAYNSVDFEIMAEAEEAGFGTYLTPLSGAAIFLLNNARPPFDDVRVRRAVVLGLDVDALNELVQRGRADVAKTLAAEGTPFYDAALTLPAHDPVEAQRLIDEVVGETGEPIAFTILTNPQNQANAEGIQTLLSQYDGLEVAIQTVASPTPDIVPGNYDMGISGLFMIDPEPRMYDRLRSGLPSNWGRYSNPEVDAALDAARASQDVEERRAAYAIVQQAIIDEAPFVTLWRIPSTLMYDASVQQIETFGDGVLLLDRVWLSE